jgi:hypothetical protein
MKSLRRVVEGFFCFTLTDLGGIDPAGGGEFFLQTEQTV